MQCDRCLVNGVCGRFKAGGECVIERERFEGVVGRLVEDYGLEGVADRVLAERAAMYLICVGRAESYVAWMGVSEKALALGQYIATLDRMLQGILGELAVTRGKRIRFEGEKALTADVESLLRRLRGRRAVKTPKKMFKPPLPGVMSRSGMRDASEWRGKIMGRLLEEWLREKSKLLKP